MTTLDIPPDLQLLIARIAALASDAGVTAYLVGGTVRDLLLRRDVHDVDIAVDRDALTFARSLADGLGGHFVALDDANAIARVVLGTRDDGDAARTNIGGWRIEDGAHGARIGHVDVAQLQGTLEQDLRRRDFTINALAATIDGGAVVDVCGGLDDLAAAVVRMNGAEVFAADPLRLLRGARIAAALGFTIETVTAAAIRERAPEVRRAAAERRRDELAQVFALDDAYGGLRLLDDLGLLDALLPEVTFGRGVSQPKEHAYDVFEHNMRAVEAMDALLAPAPPLGERDWMWDGVWAAFEWCAPLLRTYFAEEMREGRSRASLLKLTALLHDVAKPQTLTAEADGRVRFLGHADLGAAIASRIMRRYRFSSREVRFVSKLVAEHLRPGQLGALGEAPTRRALYRFYRDLGDAAPAVLFLSLADAAAARGPAMTSEGWTGLVGYVNSLLVRSQEEEGIVSPPRLLTGRDIMQRLGVPEGPEIGRLLEALEEAQAAGEVLDRDAALAYVRALAEQHSYGRAPGRAADGQQL